VDRDNCRRAGRGERLVVCEHLARGRRGGAHRGAAGEQVVHGAGVELVAFVVGAAVDHDDDRHDPYLEPVPQRGRLPDEGYVNASP